MSDLGAASRAAVPISNARAEASRRNGARSRGPKTASGKARSAQNALKHGLRAARHVVLPDEDAAEFAALEAALTDELAPQDTLQALLVGRIARAAWRLERAERLEVDLFAERLRLAADGGVGLALIRDGNSTRSFETVLRYRSAAQAEFMRALKTLKALQAEAATPVRAAEAVARVEPRRGPGSPATDRAASRAAARAKAPNEPEARARPGASEPAPPAADPKPSPAAGTGLATERTRAARRLVRPPAARPGRSDAGSPTRGHAPLALRCRSGSCASRWQARGHAAAWTPHRRRKGVRAGRCRETDGAASP